MIWPSQDDHVHVVGCYRPLLASRYPMRSAHKFPVALILLGVAALLFAACTAPGGAEPEAATATVTATQISTAVTPAGPGHSPSYNAWERGPHADTYALEKGPNTYCARCHSPANWDPQATIDPPPNCVSCKFPGESEMRVAAGNPPVPEAEWESIGCPVCHRVTDEGVVQPEIAWRDRASGYYETVPDSSALCGKCHLDNETLAHRRELGDAHAGFTCTDCHDPHATSAACADCHEVSRERPPRLIPEHADVSGNEACAECHLGAWEQHPMHIEQSGNEDCMYCHGELMGWESLTPRHVAHSAYHAAVDCVACHDATGLQIQQTAQGEAWTTFRTRELLGRMLEEPYQSHTLQQEVSCGRCHHPHNPWQLPVDVLEEVSGDGA